MLAATIHHPKFQTEAFPHIDPEVFEDPTRKEVFNAVRAHLMAYGESPTEETLSIEFGAARNLTEQSYQETQKIIKHLFSDKCMTAVTGLTETWLFTKTEKYCKDRAILNAIMSSVKILTDEDKNNNASETSIPGMLEKALSTSFNNKIGHDYLDDATKRYDYYHIEVARVASKFREVNEVTRGGYPVKSLNLFIAPTGVGKSIFLCNEAANALMDGTNVVYFTLEMAEEAIARRIDAILMDVELDTLDKMPKSTFENKIEGIRKKTPGKLIIQEFAPGSVSCANLKFSLTEMLQKKKFKPGLIVIDYLNLLGSQRIKLSNSTGSYQYNKLVAEEARALAFAFGVPVLSATQTNRAAQGASDFGMTETSESHGVNMTADFMLAGISTEQLEQSKQLRLKQLKNRYGPLDRPGSWLIGLNKDKMQMYDLENSYAINTPAPEPQKQQIATLPMSKSKKSFGNFDFGGTVDPDDVPWDT